MSQDQNAGSRIWQIAPVWRWGAVLVWAALIFAFSAQPNSAEASEIVLGDFNTLVRKAAHMAEFGILALLIRFAIKGQIKGKGNKYGSAISLLSVALAINYAASDEWHQSFVQGRGSSVIDVGIDTLGVLLAMLGLYVFGRWWKKQR